MVNGFSSKDHFDKLTRKQVEGDTATAGPDAIWPYKECPFV